MSDDTTEDSSAYVKLCSECLTGAMRLEFLTYFTWLNDELITVPNFPAWVCDICGRRQYDERAINWLNTLLNPEAGRTGSTRRSKNLPGADRAQT